MPSMKEKPVMLRPRRPMQPQTATARQAVAYVRVSTRRQVDDGVSIGAQRAKLEAWCAVMGYGLARTYADEGISGYRMDKRPGLQQAIGAVCACGGVLVVYSLSRLARNTRETVALGEQLASAGADLVSLSENIDTTSAAGKMVFRMMAVLAEFERDQISERTAVAMQHKRERGEFTGGTAPYGWRIDADGINLTAHAQEQAMIYAAQELRGGGLSLRS